MAEMATLQLHIADTVEPISTSMPVSCLYATNDIDLRTFAYVLLVCHLCFAQRWQLRASIELASLIT